MRCKCKTETDFLETFYHLVKTLEAFAALNQVCPEELHRAIAVLAADAAVKPYLAEAAVWSARQLAEAQSARH